MRTEGDDDSFEDSEGIPRYKFLYDYVTHKICEGMTKTNSNGFEEAKKGASPAELGLYYYTHRGLIKAKRDKYQAYNVRKKKPMARDYIHTRESAGLYSFIGDRIDQYIRDNDPDYDKYQGGGTMAVTTMSASKLKKSINESVETRRCRIEQAIRTKTLRIEDINTEKELVNYFAYHIKFQENAIKSIAHTIFGMKYVDIDTIHSDQNANIKSILASGVSGTGKSAMASLIRPLFHMEQGAINQYCYIELRLANYSDSSHRNAINGPGPGFEGMHEPCLVDRLEAARLSIEQRGMATHAEQPNVILVFIDELCKPKSDVRVLDSLNSLLSDGILNRSSGNITFRLPNHCKLLFYSTANYGETEIVNFRDGRRNDRRAIMAIRRDMKYKGVQPCDIGRIGNIIPFFPLKPLEAREILRASMDHYFDRPRSFRMLEEDRARFVDFYFTGNYTRAQGVRNPILIIHEELAHIHTLERYLYHTPVPEASLLSNTTPPITTLLRFDILHHTEYTPHLTGITDDDAPSTLSTRYEHIKIACSRDDVDSGNIIDCVDTDSDIGYASLCQNNVPIVVYIARPQTQYDEDDEGEMEVISPPRKRNALFINDDDDEGAMIGHEEDASVFSDDMASSIRALLANPKYNGNPLANELYDMMGVPPPHTIINVPLVDLNGKADDHVIRPTKKRRKEVQEEEDGSGGADKDATRICKGPCGKSKRLKQFEKKRKRNDKTIISITDTCSTCRKGSNRQTNEEDYVDNTTSQPD